jgi:hypothetical protein
MLVRLDGRPRIDPFLPRDGTSDVSACIDIAVRITHQAITMPRAELNPCTVPMAAGWSVEIPPAPDFVVFVGVSFAW